MANETAGIGRTRRRKALQPEQRPGEPAPPQAEVATPPLPPSRRVLDGDVVARVLKRLWRGIAGSALWPMMGRARLGIAGAWLAFTRWVKKVLSTWRARCQSPNIGVANAGAGPAGIIDAVVVSKTGARKKPMQEPRWAPKNTAEVAAVRPPPPGHPPVMVDDDPYQNKDRYEEFCEARLGISADVEICTICFFEERWRRPGGGKKRRSNMAFHFHNVHGIDGVKCEMAGCDVRFRTKEHRLLHASYCTKLWKENPKLRHKRFCIGTVEDYAEIA